MKITGNYVKIAEAPAPRPRRQQKTRRPHSGGHRVSRALGRIAAQGTHSLVWAAFPTERTVRGACWGGRAARLYRHKNLADESGCKPLIRQDAYFFGVIASLPHIAYFSELTSPFIVLAFLML